LFDGHNGTAVAIYAKENILNNILSVIPSDLNRDEWIAALPRALVAGFVKTDKEFQQKAHQVQRLTGNLRILYSALARGLIPLIGRHFLNSINMLMKQMIYSSLPQRYIDYLFLGDYVDRGQHSLETITLLLAPKIEYPENVHLIRGNHETADINALFDFRIECIERMHSKSLKK
ncbi:hypothetical protein S245_052134, partial [Arachis hypogaea]